MLLNDSSANAVILRNVVDYCNKSNEFFITNLSRNLPGVLNEPECNDTSLPQIDVYQGLELLNRKFKLRNIDIAYIIILLTRKYKFVKMAEKVFLCDNEALSPTFEKLDNPKPKLSNNFNTKSAILKAIIEAMDKDNATLIKNLIRAVPEFIERAEGVLYQGRCLSINEWLFMKEKDGKWVSEEVFRFNETSIMPWTIASLIVLQSRGYFLQEVPSLKKNDYTFIKKKYP